MTTSGTIQSSGLRYVMSSSTATTLAVAISSVTSAPSKAAEMSRRNAGPPVTCALSPPGSAPPACTTSRSRSTAVDEGVAVAAEGDGEQRGPAVLGDRGRWHLCRGGAGEGGAGPLDRGPVGVGEGRVAALVHHDGDVGAAAGEPVGQLRHPGRLLPAGSPSPGSASGWAGEVRNTSAVSPTVTSRIRTAPSRLVTAAATRVPTFRYPSKTDSSTIELLLPS